MIYIVMIISVFQTFTLDFIHTHGEGDGCVFDLLS